ncbi:PepSY domain-containing protein [Salinisphaera sp. Q1T1-3]|uniref:PepSY domain-containing protein n=1 Tax=Salinisphaera sp. Q1T1-3 TaxID=2321229 RepID=UPI0011C3A47A|nr:PepSY domain-containing protein [Salinisphaera sp. Q1T1-3]
MRAPRTADLASLHSWDGRHAAQLAVGGLLFLLSSAIAEASPGFVGLDPRTMQQVQHAEHDRSRASAQPLSLSDTKQHDQNQQKPEAKANTGAAVGISSADAARIARQRAGGRVLNVVLEDGPGGPYYLVKILEQGRVRVVHVDARP